MKITTRGLALTVASLFLVVTALDCARPASSEPLEVTYYYLPG